MRWLAHLPYLSTGQQAVTGHWRCHWDRGLCSRPPGSAFADFLAACTMVKGGLPLCRPLHLCIFLLYPRVKLLSPATSTLIHMWARGLHSLRLASRLNVFLHCKRMRRAERHAGSSFVWSPLAMLLCLGLGETLIQSTSRAEYGT